MILKFKDNVRLNFNNDENVKTDLPLSEMGSVESVEYEIWIEKNDARLKGLTLIVPIQKFSFKYKTDDGEVLNVKIDLITCDVEGDQPYPINVTAEDLEITPLEITKDGNEVKIIAQGVLNFDGGE